ncbi:acyl carrier protein [Krasilnikovia sp. MM14-A1259]|uniref:acyl carrier protein n=1 Tax=Krasilnikovia sp. MM14-A1259 TaxID=3373539 RepID=UPI00382FE9C0
MSENLTMPTFAAIAQLIGEKFEAPQAEITPDTVLESIEVDSLALIELTLLLQKQFGVTIPSGDVTPDNTVGELAAIVAAAEKTA